MIPPPAQRAMSERAGFTVVEVAGSHAIYQSQPAAVAALIEQAAAAVTAGNKRRRDAAPHCSPSADTGRTGWPVSARAARTADAPLVARCCCSLRPRRRWVTPAAASAREHTFSYFGDGQGGWPLKHLGCTNAKLASLHLIAPRDNNLVRDR
jgi:hypothetical protein